jgi:diguanylate cyclase (GGDEF)-like protein
VPFHRLCVLVVESDPAIADALVEAISHNRSASVDAATVVAVNSLGALHECDLAQADMVCCAAQLSDGDGLDALAFLRGARPDLPVVLMGDASDRALAVEAIRAGAMDYIAVGGDQPAAATELAIEKCLAHQRVRQENERLHRDLSQFAATLADKNKQLLEMIRQLESMARTDELTGLCNRRWLNEMLQRAWAEALRQDRPLAFLMMDLDGFKKLNDEFGHQRGDEVLRTAGRIIIANSRQVDVAARYGGDEFCVLMPQTQPEEAVIVARRILGEFDLAFGSQAASQPRVGICVGVSHIDLSRPVNAEQLIRHADEALYAAKASKKDRIMERRHTGPAAPDAATRFVSDR